MNLAPIFAPIVPIATALALTFGPTGAPAEATPKHYVVTPAEPMVLVPGLEFLGYSRISTVEWCAEIEQIDDYSNIITDEDLLNMEACLIEHT
jgi:hypothetical protein